LFFLLSFLSLELRLSFSFSPICASLVVLLIFTLLYFRYLCLCFILETYSHQTSFQTVFFFNLSVSYFQTEQIIQFFLSNKVPNLIYYLINFRENSSFAILLKIVLFLFL
jgi:hypothetical protein